MVLPSDPSQVYDLGAAMSVNAVAQDMPSSDLVFPENNNNKKENQMADTDYTRDFFDIRGDIKDSRYDVATRLASTHDSLSKQVDAIY